MKLFYFNYILYFRFPVHNSTGEARPHLPPLTARPWLCRYFFFLDQRVIIELVSVLYYCGGQE